MVERVSQAEHRRRQPAYIRGKRERRELHDVMQEAHLLIDVCGVSRRQALLRAATRMHYEFARGSFYQCQQLVGFRK